MSDLNDYMESTLPEDSRLLIMFRGTVEYWSRLAPSYTRFLMDEETMDDTAVICRTVRMLGTAIVSAARKLDAGLDPPLAELAAIVEGASPTLIEKASDAGLTWEEAKARYFGEGP